MVFTTKHVIYQVKVSRSRATCHMIQSATIPVLDALLARL